ncbi:SDR family oxidoreductase [Sediminibacterium soli]|uniref:SDR family oxidoreductase n=1 Tax=Sediminibacterium soli TaxID=2698829 RepID=UPI00137AC561|nr:SDR family oxidoreductase [Sediminibacterium soli]NCI46837.1 SDR family oxidoreductase [Sediminibacterium soli]
MNDLFSLKDKVIIVTGGTGILGGAFVKGIAAAGGTVVILGRNTAKAGERANEITAAGGKAMAVTADVLDEQNLQKTKEAILEKYGRIDGLVNAAGGNMPEGVLAPDADIFSMNLDGMRKAMELNLWGTIIPTQVFGAAMVKAGRGSIVNISSVSSQLAVTKVLGYSMGKAAVDCYNKWFAVEVANRFGDAIRMNSIAPGFFLTEQNRTLLTQPDGSLTARGSLVVQHTPYKRFGKPEELIGALIYLLSDASAFVTGMQLGVDGGFTIFSGV